MGFLKHMVSEYLYKQEMTERFFLKSIADTWKAKKED